MANRSMTAMLVALFHYAGQYSATQTPSTGVDTKGYDAIEAVVTAGDVSNVQTSPVGPGWTFALEHSDDNSSFSAVSADDAVMPGGGDIGANGVFGTIDDSADDSACFRVGYVGDKRYVRVVATAVNTPGNTPIAVCFLGRPLISDVN